MIDREKVVKALENCVRNGVCINCEYEEHVACKTCLMADALAMLKEQSQIVRCKDCKWHDNADISSKWLPCISMKTNPNWFCADGVKRDE